MAQCMHNLPIMMVLVERLEHSNVQLCTLCLLCGKCLEMAHPGVLIVVPCVEARPTMASCVA